MRNNRTFSACAALLLALLFTLHPAAAENWPIAAGSYNLSYVTSWDGRTRKYVLHLPTGFSPSNGIVRPLVVGLHGGGGSGRQFENSSGYSPKADTENFIVVYPTGVGILGTWNASTACCGSANTDNVDDVRFIKDLVSRLSAQYAIDPAKVFATGHSNGGVMSWRLGCDASDVFSAIAPNAGDSTALHRDGTPCDLNGRKVSVVNLHGDADTSMPYYGGAGSGLEPYVREPVEDPDPALYGGQTDIGQWTGLNGCSFTPVSTETTSGYVKKTYCGSGGVRMINYKVLGGDHAWYSTSNSSISSTDITWAFFENAAAVTTLFGDGFESGNFTAGGWTTTGNPIVSGPAAHTGSEGARLRSTSSITRLVSTLGYSTVNVEFARRTRGLNAGEFLYAEWSTNGTSWNAIVTTQDTNWATVSTALPAGAAGQSGLRLRFRTNASSTLERGDVDAVSITGN